MVKSLSPNGNGVKQFLSDMTSTMLRLSIIYLFATSRSIAWLISSSDMLAKKPRLPKFMPIIGMLELRMYVVESKNVPSPPRLSMISAVPTISFALL